MNKKSTFLWCALLVSGCASAQKLAEGYITFPGSDQLHTYIAAWNNGNGKIQMNGKDWEDEEFFTSRVKPKARFYNTATQVYSNLTQYNTSSKSGTDARYLNWVPVGNSDFNALPNGAFDCEAFSMWSYVDHYGNWTSAYGWAPAAFADAAHKNGVAVSGVASIPNSSMPSNWATCLDGVISQGTEKVAKFLFYHGVDGLGYNSEWSGWSPSGKGLIGLHDGLYTWMKNNGNNIFENIWYNGTTQNGSCSFDYPINASYCGDLIKSTSMFLNYNWYGHNLSAATYMKNNGLNPFTLYAGMNQEGSSSDNGGHFDALSGGSRQLSIGIWGSHQVNQFWKEHGVGGTTGIAVQSYYLNNIEQWYTNYWRNPAIKGTLRNIGQPVVRDQWAGISALVSARSVLNWDLKNEPFYTFFNLGNGEFFNWKGERISDNPWYSLGVQDYLPTWRFWFAPTFMATTVTESQVHMNANFTWEDAYVGGSCLKVTGSATSEYLHLFKTGFSYTAGDKVRLTFKILGGSADIDMSIRFNSPASEKAFEIATKEGCEAIENKSYTEGADGWTTVEVPLPSIMRSTTINLIGLHFKNAENLELLLGGLEIDRGFAGTTPTKPTIKSTKVLANNYSGVDAKIIWTMDGDAGRNSGTPVYNSDVNTSMYKVYGQEEGGEEVFLGATTSWAAIAFRGPNTDSNKRIRFGVKAVSMDTKSESEIAWGEWCSKGSYTASEDVEIDKTILKPNEAFSCYYVDQQHASSTWALVDANGETVATGTGIRLDVPDGLPTTGGYDLVLNKGLSTERTLGFFVQVSSEEVGALPEVYTIARDNQTVDTDDAAVKIELTDHPTLSYTGRKADGSASRAINLNNHWIGARIGDLGITATGSVSVGGWFKFTEIPDGEWNFINIVNKNDGWPQNEWGWCWNHGMANGSLHFVFRGNDSDTSQPGELHYDFPNTKIQAGMWTHIMMVFECSGSNFRCLLYINGVKQQSTWYQTKTGQNKSESEWLYRNMSTDDWCPGIKANRSDNCFVLFGGQVYQGSKIDGICDDFQVWSKAVTADDIKLSMAGITRSNIPSGLACLWDCESDANSDYSLNGFGEASSTKFYTHEWVTQPNSSAKAIEAYEPTFTPGCPFLAGTAYPVVTTAKWSDTDRKTQFVKSTSRAATEGESGSAVVSFVNPGDHTVTVTLENNYGSSSMSYPVFRIEGVQGIEDIDVDAADLNGYTIDNVLYLEFAQDGDYDVEVYNAAGMLVASQKLSAVAGQNANITLGAAGVYVVRTALNGQLLRTIKVISK
ncbi:MAG: secretion protein [Bacteroides sp.]|nr:secretion protein [Bacteroides sp.]MCM1413547.1 secretion protein [Bacteroides sp.]MCM1471101.1 secretion protein [Bacteroides sp.]